MFPVISGPRLSGWIFSCIIVACSVPWLIGCQKSEPGPISARRSQYQVADAPGDGPGATASSPAADATDPLDRSAGTRDSVSEDSSPPSSSALGEGQPPAPPRFDPADNLDLSNLDPDQLPNSAVKLQALLQVLQGRQPSGQTPQEQMEDFLSIQFTRLKAAEKLWDLAEDQETRINAIQTKMDALRIMTRFQVPDTDKELHKYCRALTEHADPEIAFLGRLMLFGLAVDDLAADVEVDIQKMSEELGSLATEADKSPNTFSVLSEAAGVFLRAGHRDEALEAYRTIGQRFQNSDDAEVAAEASAMLQRVRILEAKMDIQLQAVAAGEPDSEGPLLETLDALLAAEGAGMGTLIEMGQVATVLEMTDNYDLARQVYERIAAAFQQHPDAELVEAATRMTANGLKHVNLVGKPLEVTGVKLDGSPFDWSAYQGQVVLVSFWTWSDPCLYEISNIIQVYRQYRDQGFAVVGVNLDEDTQTVKRFMEIQPLPWSIVISADPENQGPANPLAVRCGVDLLPFAVLLDREGKVVALHARQNRLHEKLEGLLGSPTNDLPGGAPGLEPALPSQP
jgi:tetratricopeptide (TPR) repeat protein